MLRFFRNLRRNNSEDGDLQTYLWYAGGEIILVITGILIALQINNWNQERKDREIVETIMLGIKDDLLSDIREAKVIVNWYDQREIVIDEILSGNISPEYELFVYSAGMYWNPFVLNKESFEALNANKDKIPLVYQDFVKQLNTIYIQEDASIRTSQNYMDDHLNRYRNYLVNEEEWFLDYSQDRITDNVINYFNNSELHKRKLVRYTDLSESISNRLLELINRATYGYVVLHNMLEPEEEYSPYIELPDIEVANSKASGVDGIYFEEQFQTKIIIERINNVLTFIVDTPVLSNSEPYLLTDLPGDTLGSMVDEGFLVIQRDERNRVNGLKIWRPNGVDAIIPKIK